MFTDFQNFTSKIDNVQIDVLKPLEDDINKVRAMNVIFIPVILVIIKGGFVLCSWINWAHQCACITSLETRLRIVYLTTYYCSHGH